MQVALAESTPLAVEPPVEGRGQWYVVEAEEGQAQAVFLRLAILRLQVWMPLILKRPARYGVSKGKPRRDIYVPRFGRYFFVRCDLNNEIWTGINMQTGIRGMLVAQRGERPVAIPSNYMDWLRVGIENEGKLPECPYTIGDIVRILDGPFIGFEAKVTAVDNIGVVRVDVEIFGRPTPTIVEVGHVEMVQPAKSRAISSLGKRSAKG